MIHYITEGGDGNKELKTHRWFIPDGVRHHLEKIKDDNKKEELSKNHTTKEAWDHLEFILGEEKGISYQEMKRMKNWFDKNYNATKTKQYELYGGDIMKTWVENQLKSATLYVKKHKEAQRAMGKENAFIKPHEADRQNVVSKVDTKVPTYNPATLNKQNRLKELGELKEQKTVIINESQKKQLQEVISDKIKSDFFNELEAYASVDDFNACVKLCMEYLDNPAACGSSRFVFEINDEQVLKLATNDKGILQNKSEVESYKKTVNFKDIFPIVFHYSPSYTYIVSERVLPLDDKDIVTCFGMHENSFFHIVHVISSCYDDNKINWERLNRYDPHLIEWIEQFTSKNKNLELLINYLFKNPVLSDETYNEDNMGITKRNGKTWVVLLDNGWNGNTADAYGFYNFGELNV